VRRRYTLPATLLLCAAVGSHPLKAECVAEPKPPMAIRGMLCGTVTDLTREPLENTDIDLRDEDGRDVVVHTDRNGHFDAPRLATGRYRFKLLGFHDTWRTVQVAGNQTRCESRLTVVFVVAGDCDSELHFEGQLRLTANIGGALIAIDDTEFFPIAFDPPEDFLLDEGIHHIAIDAEGYRPLQFHVTIRANRTTTRRATLVPERRAQ
jgi:hypothetical protein